jgi:hypothetical protein
MAKHPGFSQEACSKSGLSPLGLCRPGLSPACILSGANPLRVLLQGLCPPRFLSRALPTRSFKIRSFHLDGPEPILSRWLSRLSSHCCNDLGVHCYKNDFKHIVATPTMGHTVATMTVDTITAFVIKCCRHCVCFLTL